MKNRSSPRFKFMALLAGATVPVLGMLPMELAAQGQVELGAGFSSEDSFKLGEYNGLVDSQVFGVGAFSLENASRYDADTSSWWSLNGANLGLETRSLEAATGSQGNYLLRLSWREMPHYRFDNPVSTPFSGAGSAYQTLPSNWTGASNTAGLAGLKPALHDIAVKTDRERLQAELTWHLNPLLVFSGEYRHENKKGNDTLGAIFGSSGGNPRGAILAAPVDYQTDSFMLGLAWEGSRGSSQVFYKASLFSNKNESLSWDNPFNNTAWLAGANHSDGAIGQMALAPDNRFFQTGISSVYALGDSARISGSLSVGEMSQDETLLPYSNVFSAALPLPVTSLDGTVGTLNGFLNLSWQAHRKLNLRLRYSHDERNNDTRINLFQRIPGDAAAQGDYLSSNARLNRPYSFRNQTYQAAGDIRLSAGMKLAVEYELEDRHRNRVDVDRIREHQGTVRLDMSRLFAGRGWVRLTRADRNGSAYTGNQGFLSGHNPDFINTLTGNELFENDPLLRRYNLADRDRNQLAFSITQLPTEKVSLDIIGKLSNDRFPDSKIGVQESRIRHLTFNLGLEGGENWHAWTYLTAERYANSQRGFSRRGGGSPTPFFPESVRQEGNNWRVDTRDRVITTGAGAELTWPARRLSLEMDINRSRAATETAPFSTGLAWDELADVNSTMTTVSLQGTYQMESGNRIGLRYRYENYDSDDFALDRVVVDTLDNIILLGNASPNYAGHIVELTYQIALPGN